MSAEVTTERITEVTVGRFFGEVPEGCVGIWTDADHGWTLEKIEHTFTLGDVLVICHEPTGAPEGFWDNENRRIVWYTINGGPRIYFHYGD